jgi:hypothetical protein
MSQRHPFSTVSCFRRFASRDKINWYDLNMYIINVIADDETKIGLYEIYFLDD